MSGGAAHSSDDTVHERCRTRGRAALYMCFICVRMRARKSHILHLGRIPDRSSSLLGPATLLSSARSGRRNKLLQTPLGLRAADISERIHRQRERGISSRIIGRRQYVAPQL